MSDVSPNASPREHLSALLSLAPRAMRAVWIGGIALAIGLGGTVAWTLSTAHLYRSEAVIAFDHGVRTATVGASDHDAPREIGSRLRESVMSRKRLDSIIQELNLYRGIAEHQGIGAAIDEMRKHLDVGVRDESAYRITYDANGRELAQRVLETIIKQVIDEDTQRRNQEAGETKRFLDVERKHADEDLKARDQELAVFISHHPRIAGEAAGNGATAGATIRAENSVAPGSDLSGDIARLELQAAQFEEQLAAAGVRVPSAVGGVTGDPGLLAARGRAQTELQAAQRDLQEKQAHFTNEHPDVKSALRRVAVAEADFHRAEAALEADKSARGAEKAETPAPADTPEDGPKTTAIKHALAAVRQQIQSLRGRNVPHVDEPKGAGSSSVAIDTEWTRLNRAWSEARERQMQIEGRQFQAELMATLAAGGQGGRLVVIDPPFRPVKPITGGRFKIALVGLLASVFLALLTVVLFAAFDDRLYGERDVQRVVRDGIVVAIPKLAGKSG